MTAPAALPVPPDVEHDLLRPPPPVPLREVSATVARPTAAVFGTLSRLRGRRAMHPVGVVRAASLTVSGR